MGNLETNIISAIVIGIIIAVMASVASSKLKALIYSLPIPITVALIATGGDVNVTHIIGLVLITLFLWTVKTLYTRGVNIYVADVVATGLYIAGGYFAIGFFKMPFFVAVVLYAIGWAVFMTLYRNHPPSRKSKSNTTIRPIVKLPIVSLFAFILLNLKSYLSGIIVTFPFSGVFAVVEGRGILRTLAATFTRNSIAILMMFVTIYLFGSADLFLKLVAGWIVYIITLRAVSTIKS
jgi:hypothetical protein